MTSIEQIGEIVAFTIVTESGITLILPDPQVADT